MICPNCKSKLRFIRKDFDLETTYKPPKRLYEPSYLCGRLQHYYNYIYNCDKCNKKYQYKKPEDGFI